MNQKRPSVLATDLDGTLIPLKGDPGQVGDLQRIARAIRQKNQTLVFVTGRHLASVQKAIEQFHLPMPDWLICDVGTSIYKVDSGSFALLGDYADALENILQPGQLREIQDLLDGHEKLEIQESEKQGRFKLSYYTEADQLARIEQEIVSSLVKTYAVQLIRSVDPFTGQGLIDLLPRDVSKAFALQWWTEHQNVESDEIVFAGDSGNDLAALVGGCRAILVGNAPRELAEQVAQSPAARVYFAEGSASSGVWEGGVHWGLFDLPAEKQ